jgi:choice-of-anchor A domain-containing protein
MRVPRIGYRALFALGVAFGSLGSAPARADFTGLGQAGNYVVFGLGQTSDNNQVNLSLATVNGDIAASSGWTVLKMAPSVINGDVFLDNRAPAATYSGGAFNGSTFSVNLAQANTDALNAYNNNSVLSPTQTINSSVTTNTTITGNGGLNVIKINGDITLGGSNSLTLSGSASDFFVVNVTGALTMTGSSNLAVSGGVTAAHVLWEFIGPNGGDLSTHVGNNVFGTILAPNYSYSNGDGTLNGAIIAGALGSDAQTGSSAIKLLSGYTANFVPLTPVPEPSSVVLTGMGFGIMGLIAWRRRRVSA